MSVYLRCVKEGSKLRIRVESYQDDNGIVRVGVYNNNYNCQFPRNIRQEGRFYKIPKENIKLCASGHNKPFYRVGKAQIQILDSGSVQGRYTENDQITIDNIQIYGEDLEECVVCMDTKPNVVIVPCGHLCCCENCSLQLDPRKCPICRGEISSILNYN